MGQLRLPERNRLVTLLPVLTFLSITWTAWLPTYAHFRRAELQGRKVRVRGRERYIVNLFPLVEFVTTDHLPRIIIQILQAAVWVGRMFTATLVALSWHRPSMDFLSMRSRPASLGSRIYFSFVLCFELFVSKLFIFSCKLRQTFHRYPYLPSLLSAFTVRQPYA
jgi:hypothetical protein